MESIQPNDLPSDEQIFYQSGRVIVTDSRVLLGSASYSVSAISSIKVQSRPLESRGGRDKADGGSTAYRLGLFVVGTGVAFSIAGFVLAADSPVLLLPFLAIGVVLAIMGFLVLGLRPDSRGQSHGKEYAVKFRTVDGEEERIKGLDKLTAREIADAISRATIRKEKQSREVKDVSPQQ